MNSIGFIDSFVCLPMSHRLVIYNTYTHKRLIAFHFAFYSLQCYIRVSQRNVANFFLQLHPSNVFEVACLRFSVLSCNLSIEVVLACLIRNFFISRVSLKFNVRLIHPLTTRKVVLLLNVIISRFMLVDVVKKKKPTINHLLGCFSLLDCT